LRCLGRKIFSFSSGCPGGFASLTPFCFIGLLLMATYEIAFVFSYGPGLVTGGVLSGWLVAMRRAAGCSGCVTVVRCSPVPRVAIAPISQLPSGIRGRCPVSCCGVWLFSLELCSRFLISSYRYRHMFLLIDGSRALLVS